MVWVFGMSVYVGIDEMWFGVYFDVGGFVWKVF